MRALIAALLITLSAPALAHDFKVGDIALDHPVARATPPGAKVGGGYLMLVNSGDTTDRLIGGSADFAARVEIHEMAMENDVMKMRAIEGGLEIPAGGEAVLKPGGNHVMFMGLKEPLVEGEERKATLIFEKAGPVEIVFKVESIANTMKMDHDKMKMN
ncbi:MAG: copper chaperone PCu(A)C [Pseudomonadota bacterium]